MKTNPPNANDTTTNLTANKINSSQLSLLFLIYCCSIYRPLAQGRKWKPSHENRYTFMPCCQKANQLRQRSRISIRKKVDTCNVYHPKTWLFQSVHPSCQNSPQVSHIMMEWRAPSHSSARFLRHSSTAEVASFHFVSSSPQRLETICKANAPWCPPSTSTCRSR